MPQMPMPNFENNNPNFYQQQDFLKPPSITGAAHQQ